MCVNKENMDFRAAAGHPLQAYFVLEHLNLLSELGYTGVLRIPIHPPPASVVSFSAVIVLCF